MRTIIKTALAGIMLATAAVTSVAPAAADPRQDRYIESYYRDHDRDRNYYRWHRDRDRWDRSQYRRWYRDRHHDNDFGAAAAIFGLAAGAIAGAAAAGAANYDVDEGWLAACSRKYRSFDPSTGTYLGYDGRRHPCRL